MLSSFIRVALRYFSKNRLYTALNVFGLTVGLTCFIILGLYVKEQFDRDSLHNDSQNIYRVLAGRTEEGKPANFSPFNQFPLGEMLENEVPEIKNTVRFGQDGDIVIEANNRKFKLPKIHLADPSLFDVFNFRVLAQAKPLDKQTVNELVLVKSEAVRLFGSAEDALNQTVKLSGYGDYKIIGVLDDLGQETHMDFKFILPIDAADVAYGEDGQYKNWNRMSGFPTYVLLEDGTDPSEITEKSNKALLPYDTHYELKLEPVSEVYFSKLFPFFKKHGDRQFIQLYLLVGILILLIACINYTNLSTARYLKRAKEVGIRKTVGGYRSQIITQFFIESIVISFIAVVLSICVTELLLPSFNSFAESSIFINYQNPFTYVMALAAVVVLGLFSGLYPAIFLSRFSASQILSGKATKGKSGLVFRNVLVVVQFFICIGLFISTNVIFNQFQHLKKLDLGLDRDQVIRVPLDDEGVKKSYNLFKNELSANPSIEWATGAGPQAFGGTAQFYIEIDGSDESTPVSIFPVDDDFFQKFNIKKVAGRLFDPELGKDENNFLIVNQALVDVGGWKIEDKLGKQVSKENIGLANLGGVVEDFVFFSAKNEVLPAAFLYKPEKSEQAYIKVKAADLDETIAFIQSTYEKFATLYPFEYTFLDQDFAKEYTQEQRLASIFTSFSSIAIFIALLGLFGLTLFLAEQRLKEFSIRKVLGASTTHLVWLMNSGISRMILISTVMAIPLVYYLMDKWISGFAFRIDLSWWLFALPVLLVVAFAWLTTIYQSISSAHKNPTESLRSE